MIFKILFIFLFTNTNEEEVAIENLVGNYTKAKKLLNWKPKIKFNSLVKLMVEEDLKVLSIKNKKT